MKKSFVAQASLINEQLNPKSFVALTVASTYIWVIIPQTNILPESIASIAEKQFLYTFG